MKYKYLFLCFFIFFTTKTYAISYDEYVKLNDINEEYRLLMLGDITNTQHYASSCSQLLVSKYGNVLKEKITSTLLSVSIYDNTCIYGISYLIQRMAYCNLLDDYSCSLWIGLLQKLEIDYVKEKKCIDENIAYVQTAINRILGDTLVSSSFLNSGIELKQTFETLLDIEVEVKAPFYETNPWE